MSVINKENFEILRDNAVEPGEYFTCDEEIDETISLLNRKGYITKSSCCGHLYDAVMGSGVYNPDIKPGEVGWLRVGETAADKANENDMVVKLEFNMLVAYIDFENKEHFDTLPAGWEMYNEDHISFDYEELDEAEHYRAFPFYFYRERCRVMEELYHWAENLPDKALNDQ